ncbi:MAG: hypothetical protein DRP45_06900 [Candidatus Zixiibacteriota bacterium]|nr:MAG: hypothetical protein DRP45_06900 [candidate division Zixibacteria bacterium]
MLIMGRDSSFRAGSTISRVPAILPIAVLSDVSVSDSRVDRTNRQAGTPGGTSYATSVTLSGACLEFVEGSKGEVAKRRTMLRQAQLTENMPVVP